LAPLHVEWFCDGMKKILHEIELFKSKPLNMRVLLLTNLIYIAVLPISGIFTSAYVMRNSGHDMTYVAIYQLASYVAIPLAFWLNGLILNYVRIERMYSLGMFLSALSMLVIMTLPHLTITGLACAGFLMSFSSGFYWANRDFLALSTTSDSTRNYYYGIDQFFSTNIGVITPFLVGDCFIANVEKYHWFDLSVDQAYQVVVGLVFVLVFFASIMIHQGNFKNPKKTRFVYVRFHKQWKWIQLLTVVRGLAQGYMTLVPTLLILTLIGNEGAVGRILSGGGILSAVTLYILGRTTGPKHRLLIYSVSVVAFAVGALTNSLLYSAVGVLIFIVCQTLSAPLQEIAYFGTQMLLIDVTSFLEKRNEYAYIFNLEFSYLLGRCSGLIFFMFLAQHYSNGFALRYALPLIAVIQLTGILLVKHILEKCHQEKALDLNQAMDLATLNAQLATGEAL
jgi:YQGE family putative transporter